MEVRITYITGERVLWSMTIDEFVPYAGLVALAKLPRPYEARRLQARRRDVLSRRSVEFAAGASATLLGDTLLVITTGWGRGPRLMVFASDPIELASSQLAEGIRPACPGSNGIPTEEFVAGDRDTRQLVAAGSYVLDREQGVLASSDAGSLRTGADAARLLPVLMDPANEFVPLHELQRQALVADPGSVVRDLRQRAANVGFPLPAALDSGSAAFLPWPTPCEAAVVCLTDDQLRSCGLGWLAREHYVFVGGDTVSVTQADLEWARCGQMIEPTAANRPWKLAIQGSGIRRRRVVEVPLEGHPCGGPGGLRAAIVHVMADPRPCPPDA